MFDRESGNSEENSNKKKTEEEEEEKRKEKGVSLSFVKNVVVRLTLILINIFGI